MYTMNTCELLVQVVDLAAQHARSGLVGPHSIKAETVVKRPMKVWTMIEEGCLLGMYDQRHLFYSHFTNS